MGMKNLNQIATVSKVPVPNEIMEHFKHIKCHCMMGLFPEIGRAWMTIDSDIYIWTYEQSRDVAYFDGLSDLIVSVGLVQPKSGVFISDVKYLLVLTTPVEIVVLGVTFGDGNKGLSSPTRSVAMYEEMQLLNKPIFILNTDNVPVNVVKGTKEGRIFLGGKDGSLYEVDYQAESNWFGKRCKKINHSLTLMSYMVPGFLKIFSEIDPITKIVVDDSRRLLYVLTEKGAIEAWDLSADSNQMRRLARVSPNDIAQTAGNIVKTVEPTAFKPVTALCPLTYDDYPNLHLLGITHSGVRFYFSTTAINVNLTQPQHHQTEQSRPQGLYLLHVRLPPGYTPNTTVGKPKQVHSAFFKDGSLLMVSTPAQDQDLLFSLSSEPFPFRPFLAESSTIVPLDGQVWDLAETRNRENALVTPIKQAQTPRKIVILTNQGAHIVALLKPVDLFQQLLVACHGAHHEAVKAYFQTQSEPQACATSLALACMESVRGTEIVQWATQAFLLYGGEPHFGVAPRYGNAQPNQQGPNSSYIDQTVIQQQQAGNSPQMYMSTPFPGAGTRPASQIQQSLMQQTQFPVSPIQGGVGSPFNSSVVASPNMQQDHHQQQNLNYSAKHAGLYLHISRLLRLIWRRRCINQNLTSTLTQQDCVEVLSDLYAIKAFLEINSVSHLTGIMKMNSVQGQSSSMYGAGVSFGGQQQTLVNGNHQKKSAEEAQTEEKKSLDALNRFIRHTAEVIALWKILCEHQFHLLIGQLPQEQQHILLACSFRDLILHRTDICASLIVTLINTYLNDSASVSSISSKLRDVCPTLYRHEDAVSHKATEILMLSKNCTDYDEKDERLRTALQLCKSAAPKLPLANICQQFVMAGFYQGVIDLVATCAMKVDPNEVGLHFYKNHEPMEDQEGFIAYNTRREFYKEVKEMLETVYQNLCNANVTLDVTRGAPMTEDKEKSVKSQILQIVGHALQSSDKLLHNSVYEWLLSRDLLSELLGISEQSLGEFLSRSAARAPDNLKLSDLLWKYHERNGQHSAAARILDNLASSETEAIDLQQRIEYLARAIMCMRSDSVGASAHNGVLLKELEDKLEIARVQKQILDAVGTFTATNNTKDAIRSLNSSLYNMTHLYSDFCEDFDLWECKLMILSCSHHNDPLLIESVWTKILDKELQLPDTNTEKVRHMLLKVQSLAAEYGNGGYCFPLRFIVREMEVRCFKLRVYDSPVPEALLAMNLDIDSLLDIYASMVSMNERIWATEDDELYLVRATTKLLSILSSDQSLVHPKNRRRMVAKSQDLISACLNLLYTKPNTEECINNLREIQAKLQRFV
uniref:CSON006340 protein n=1 Tax=Culicoides sonorensis TaxID=179676 RepID=A0A336MUH0_CULSO